MTSILVALKRAGAAHVAAAEPLFRSETYPTGAWVTREGETADTLLYLERGRLVIEVDGFETHVVAPGAFFGEIALFSDDTRTASARATEPVTVRVLSRSDYATLASDGSPVALEVERISIENLVGRLRTLAAEIGTGDATRSLTEGVGGRLTAGRPVSSTDAQIAKRLLGLPTFMGVDPAVCAALAADFSVKQWAAGEKLQVPDVPAGNLQIVLSGDVDRIAPTEHGRGVLISRLGAGTVVGLASALMHDEARTLVIASEAVTALCVAKSAFDRLLTTLDPRGTALRVACVRDLANQVTNANATVSMIHLLSKR